jgi:hypothetical protein
LTTVRSALRSPEKIKQLLDKTEDLSANEYDLAQSLIPLLVVQDSTGLMRFITLLKQGETQSAALQDAFHLTTTELVRRWTLFWQYALARQGQ